ncbi:MAG: ATP-grasp domain-containing protein [Halobacteria archaeon]|nr:ATP-grasp domain-containing protein [Halobacteria archaeon]
MKDVTAIVTGVGGGVGQSIIKGLNLSMERRGDVEYTIVGVDADPLASGLYRTDVGYTVPLANEDGYVDRLIDIANEEDADILIPGSDPEVLEVSENKKRLEEEGEVKVLASPEESVRIGLDKWETYRYLNQNGFNTPLTVLPDDADELVSQTGYPVVVKPRTGSASRGLFIATDSDELDYALSHSDDVIVQEYLVPENWDSDLDKNDLQRQIDEYSTEVIVSSDGEVVNSLSNWRKMDKGIPSIAKIKPYNEVREACEEIVESLDVLGPVNLQARITSDGPTFFELNTRFSGSTAVRCVAGFNGPDTMVRDLVLDEDIDESYLEYENLVEMRYKDEIYISEEDYEAMRENGKVEGGSKKYDYY